MVTGRIKETKSIKVQTPIGTIESDSGSHAIDVLTVLGFAVFLVYIAKKFKKWRL